MGRGRTRTVLLVLLVILVAGGAGAGGYLGTRALRATDEPVAAPAVTPSAYAAADSKPPSAGRAEPAGVDRAALTRALTPALGAAGLGPRVLVRVTDTTTGRTLFDRSGTTTAAPASTAKITTAAAVLTVRAATDRITTTAVSDGRGTLVLVGGGDPTLSAARAGADPAYPDAARLSDLAAQVRKAGVRVTRILVDDGLYSGPSVSPDWAAEDVPSDYGAAITPVMADGGRATPDAAVRSSTPDLDAGRSLAMLLGRPSLPVARGTIPATGRTVVGTVRSAPIATLVEQMLLGSDNVIAECLARQVALARGATASFTGAASAVRAVLRGIGVDIGGGLVDGSGLAPRDRLAPATLTTLLRTIVASTRPGVRGVATSLPVAGWSGSLAARFVTGSSAAGAGLVRAKTGTLTGVSTLAGLAHTRGGGLVSFAVFADRNTDTSAAQAALDALVTRLATCRC